MSWVTFDDGAPLHRKQLAAGAKACWLWACGLAYCYGQESEDGFIPEAVVKILYPRLGPKEAEALVKVGLWERADGGYLIHDYLEWKERRFNGPKNSRGKAGGSVSSEAKRQAALAREAGKRIARQSTTSTTTTEHNGTQQETTTIVTTTTSPTAGLDLASGIFDPIPSPDPEQPESFRLRRGGWLGRAIVRDCPKGEEPDPRHDPAGERFPFGRWSPSQQILDWTRAQRLPDKAFDKALIELKDKVRGLHDLDYWDTKAISFLEQAIAWHATPPGAPERSNGKVDPDWPPESLKTRAEIRAGKHGKSLQAKEAARTVDYPTALRLIRERNAELAERAAERRPPSDRPPPGLAVDVPGGSLATLTAGIGRTIT